MSDQDQVTPEGSYADRVLAQLDIRLEWVIEETRLESDGTTHSYATVYVNGEIVSGPWDFDYETKLYSTRNPTWLNLVRTGVR